MANVPSSDGLVGLTTPTALQPFGSMPNENQQKFPGFMTGAPYELAVVEFDDEGRCYERGQMRGIADRLAQMSDAGEDAIIVVFVHGWKHNARSDDDNLTNFRILLARTVEHENAKLPPGASARPVLGIFVGWRGLSEYGLGDAVADATFWTRQAAAQRVSTGSVRELFGRLRHYRNHRLRAQPTGAPLLVISGHSFGGMIVFAALAQSLIEAASSPVGHIVPSLADIVLLVNPAIEGARYLPIYDLVSDPSFALRAPQLPIFICAQAANDEPVGTFFPIGNAAHRAEQSTIGSLEAECVTKAFGFVDSFQTHELSGPVGTDPFVLQPADSHQANPFWMVRATKNVIDGHGGIWLDPLQRFLASIVFKQVEHTAARRLAVGGAVSAAVSSNLAAYASGLKPF